MNWLTKMRKAAILQIALLILGVYLIFKGFKKIRAVNPLLAVGLSTIFIGQFLLGLDVSMESDKEKLE